MSSRAGGGQYNGGDGNEPSLKVKHVAAVPSTDVDQLNQGLGGMSLDSSQDDDWEVYSKKNKNGGGNGVAWSSETCNSKAWGQADAWRNGGWGSDGPAGAVGNARPPKMGDGGDAGSPHPCVVGEVVPEAVDIGNDTTDGSEDELLSDDYDSDESHDSRKKNPWFLDFFGTLDTLTVDQITEPARQWHCPACQNGPGSIYWYRSLQSLVTHIKTKGSTRVKLHQHLAEILEEELCQRGVTVGPAGEAYGRWKGLDENVKDWEIVWPPMVVVMNTQLEKDENEKWIGLGNQELIDYFDSYEAARARHSFGPDGHRGMSVLIFETSAVGYLEAERLSKHFEHQGTDRYAWDRHPNLFLPGGKRQLYGYMATKTDLDIFNRHSPGKLKLKFELVSYQEKVVKQFKQMNEDNQQLHWYKEKIAKQERNSKALEETIQILSQKLRKFEEENHIVRQRTQLYHEQNREAMDFQEQFFKEQLKVIQDARDAQDKEFEKLQQEEHERVEKSCAAEDSFQREGKVILEMKKFKEARERMLKLQEEERAEMKLRHGKQEVEMEKRFNVELDQLMEEYTSHQEVESSADKAS